jgi:hypothetical protein
MYSAYTVYMTYTVYGMLYSCSLVYSILDLLACVFIINVIICTN